LLIKKMFTIKFDDWNEEAHVYQDGAYYLTIKYHLLPLNVARSRIFSVFGSKKLKQKPRLQPQPKEEPKVCGVDFSAPQIKTCNE